MQDKHALFFKVLLNRFHPGAKESQLKAFSPEETAEVFKQTITATDPSFVFSWTAELLGKTHYSWFAPAVRLMPRHTQTLLIASLPKNQAAGLQQLLQIKSIAEEPSPPVKKFLISRLYTLWNPQEAVPIACLPTTQLTPLLKYSKNELVELCDFLALHDLAEAIRHIVDKKYLKALYVYLSPKKQQYLRLCLHKREKVTTPKLNLAKWDQKAESLQTLLHQRGLLRFGKALCGQDAAFVWHITHTLDTGRGHVISKYYAPNKIPGVTTILAQQLLSLINFLKHKSRL